MNRILSEIRRCDVVLRCGNELYVGLSYDEKIADSPIVICKGKYDYNYYLMKVGELLHVPCIEHKILARELFYKLEIGDIVPPDFFHELAIVYSHLDKFKKRDDQDEFIEKQNRDFGNQIYAFEKNHFQKVIRKIRRRKRLAEKQFEGDVVKLFEEEIKNLTEKYELNCRTYHNAVFKTDEFYLESFIEEYGLEFWQIVFISKEEKKITIGTRLLFKSFDFSEAHIAIEVFKALVETNNTDFRKIAIEHCEEIKTNPKLCEIVTDTIRTMLNLNYKERGIEYGFCHDTIISVVYLRPANSSSMYEILIFHKDFLKHPQDFKELIKNPRQMKEKDMVCTQKKYDPEKMDEKFKKENQPIEQ